MLISLSYRHCGFKMVIFSSIFHFISYVTKNVKNTNTKKIFELCAPISTSHFYLKLDPLDSFHAYFTLLSALWLQDGHFFFNFSLYLICDQKCQKHEHQKNF